MILLNIILMTTLTLAAGFGTWIVQSARASHRAELRLDRTKFDNWDRLLVSKRR